MLPGSSGCGGWMRVLLSSVTQRPAADCRRRRWRRPRAPSETARRPPAPARKRPAASAGSGSSRWADWPLRSRASSRCRAAVPAPLCKCRAARNRRCRKRRWPGPYRACRAGSCPRRRRGWGASNCRRSCRCGHRAAGCTGIAGWRAPDRGAGLRWR